MSPAYKSAPDFLENDDGPHSGVHEMTQAEVYDESIVLNPVVLPAEGEGVQDRENVDDTPASWIENLIRRVRKSFSSAPSMVDRTKERIPMDEQELIDALKIAEERLVSFRMIVENRELLHLNARAAGMSEAEVFVSDDSRLDPELTQKWKQRVAEKEQEIFQMRMKLDTKRTERTACGVSAPRR